MGSFGLFVTFTLVSLFAQCLGQATVCNETLTGEFGNIVVEATERCVLSSVTANTVTVNADGKLAVNGISVITGINGRNGAVISLENQTSVGTVTATNSASIGVTVENTAFVESLVLSDAGSTSAQGPFGSIESVNSGVLNVSFSTVRDDIRVQRGVGDVNICGSTIIKRTLITSRPGELTFGNFAGCPGSRFEGELSVAGGRGSVTFQSSIATEISFANRIGVVTLSSSSLGTTSLSSISGDVSITTSTANEESTLENIQGAVTLSGSAFFGSVVLTEETRRGVGLTTIKESSFRASAGGIRLSVQRRGELSVTSTNFFNGGAAFTRNAGPVIFNGNGDVNATFTQDNGVQIFDNNIGNADLTSCTGGALIERNVFRNAVLESCSGNITIARNLFATLGCTGNTPAPVGTENTISELATGQCAEF